MKVKRIAVGTYEIHTNHGAYKVDNCPADNPRATGLPAGPRWMVTYPGEYTADAEFRTKREAVAHIRVLHDEHMRKADVERQNRARLASMPARQKADPETVAEIYAERCPECKGSGCPTCGYKGRPRPVTFTCTCPRGESEVYAAHHRTVCGLNWQAASFADFAVGDRIRFQTVDNGFGGSGDFVSRTGTVTAVTASTLRVECDWNWFGNRAVLRRADWHRRDPQRVA